MFNNACFHIQACNYLKKNITSTVCSQYWMSSCYTKLCLKLFQASICSPDDFLKQPFWLPYSSNNFEMVHWFSSWSLPCYDIYVSEPYWWFGRESDVYWAKVPSGFVDTICIWVLVVDYKELILRKTISFFFPFFFSIARFCWYYSQLLLFHGCCFQSHYFWRSNTRKYVYAWHIQEQLNTTY